MTAFEWFLSVLTLFNLIGAGWLYFHWSRTDKTGDDDADASDR